MGLTRPALTWLQATRPAFLSITALAILAGAAHAWSQTGILRMEILVPALICALLAHAGANVLNDVCDAANGTDAANVDRVAPFTGGSRFIQEGELSARAMRHWAIALLALAAVFGLALAIWHDPRLLLLGFAGLGLGVAYSTPPLALMSRGLGEMAVGGAWLLVVAGTDFMLRGRFDPDVLWVAAPFGLQAMLILIVNQVPDFRADQAAGKRNWVVRLGRERAAAVYAAIAAPAYGIVGAAIIAGALAVWSAAVVLALPAQVLAIRLIARHHADSQRMRRPIVLTLASTHLFGLVLALSLVADRLSRTA